MRALAATFRLLTSVPCSSAFAPPASSLDVEPLQYLSNPLYAHPLPQVNPRPFYTPVDLAPPVLSLEGGSAAHEGQALLEGLSCTALRGRWGCVLAMLVARKGQALSWARASLRWIRAFTQRPEYLFSPPRSTPTHPCPPPLHTGTRPLRLRVRRWRHTTCHGCWRGGRRSRWGTGVTHTLTHIPRKACSAPWPHPRPSRCTCVHAPYVDTHARPHSQDGHLLRAMAKAVKAERHGRALELAAQLNLHKSLEGEGGGSRGLIQRRQLNVHKDLEGGGGGGGAGGGGGLVRVCEHTSSLHTSLFEVSASDSAAWHGGLRCVLGRGVPAVQPKAGVPSPVRALVDTV